MQEFDAATYQDKKGSFNDEDERLLLSLLQGTQGSILDVGCGDGLLTRQVKQLLPQCPIAALDNSADQIRLARAAAEGITFIHADIREFSSEPFDTAYSFYAFPHIPKSGLASALAAVRKLLKPGGKFYLFTNICLFDTANVPAQDQEACDITFLNNWPSQINLVSLKEAQALHAAAGFAEIENRQLVTGADVKTYGKMISWLFVLQ
jgi:cyclopropane fatty-acyl-phospholipid synthase-like methyltransferase